MVRRALVAGVVLLGLLPLKAEAQSPAALSSDCITAGGDTAVCAAAAVASRALLGHIGIGAGAGSEVTGTASNLGRRAGGPPRFAFSLRAGGVRARLPDVSDASGLGEASLFIPTIQASATAGLFDGFRLMPTVGGFLSVDAFSQVAFVLLPSDEGFDDRATAYSVGLRLGVFRESFTLPGVSVSLARRFVGDVALGSTSDPARVGLDPSITSLRATLGKDLFAFEVLAGFGWEDYSGDVTYTVTDGGTGTVSGGGGIDASRRLYFVSVARTFSLIFTFSAEGGIARGFDSVPGYNSPDFDPTDGTFFGSLSFRLTI